MMTEDTDKTLDGEQTFELLRSGAVAATEGCINELVASSSYPPNLEDAVRYASLNGGKRTRPVLVFLSARASVACSSANGGGGWTERVNSSAAALGAAIELVHAFSLVHDDLPCLDNDLLRRGLPTTHAKFGEAMGLLAGDALLNLAYGAVLGGELTDSERGRALGILSSATNSMIGGQVLDTLGDGDACSSAKLSAAERLEAIHAGKTGALIEASCRLGGVAAGIAAGEREEQSLIAYGQALGLMFQIVDDIIDETQDASHAGKETGKDAAAGKLTYPVVHGLEWSRGEVVRLLGVAEDSASSLGGDACGLIEYARVLASRTR